MMEFTTNVSQIFQNGYGLGSFVQIRVPLNYVFKNMKDLDFIKNGIQLLMYFSLPSNVWLCLSVPD